MARLKNTKADWILKDCTIINSDYDPKKGNIKEIAQCYTGFDVDNTITQCKANAELFLDAGNTANKCDLLPSELLKQRDNLLKALKEANNLLKQRCLDTDRELLELDIDGIINEVESTN
jgi:hypothetical protein